MTTVEVLQAAQTALLNDAELTAWCQDQFAKAPSIWIGIDEQNPPAESDYPVVSLVGVDQSRGRSRGEIEWRIHIGVGVVNSELTSDDAARSYTGMLQAEALRESVENALYRSKLPGLTVDLETSGEASSVSYHPLYVAYTTVIFSGLKSTRRGLP